MNPFSTLENLIERPESLAGAERPEGLGRTGLLGYAAGTLGLFAFMRLSEAVPPGFLSFCVVLGFVLAANFFFAGVIHLFMSLTGEKGDAGRLFLAFGCADMFGALLVPLAFLARVGVLNGFLWLCACALLVLYARVRLVLRLYPVSANKAVLAVWLPYMAVGALFFAAMVYSIAWLVWLVI